MAVTVLCTFYLMYTLSFSASAHKNFLKYFSLICFVVCNLCQDKVSKRIYITKNPLNFLQRMFSNCHLMSGTIFLNVVIKQVTFRPILTSVDLKELNSRVSIPGWALPK